MKRNRVWIVEMLNCCYANIKPRWEPTVGCALDRSGAREEARKWREKNQYDNLGCASIDPLEIRGVRNEF